LGSNIAVLQHEVFGVGPVVGNLAAVVVAHHVGFAGDVADRVVGDFAGRDAGLLRLFDEAVHRASIDVSQRGAFAVRPAVVDVDRAVVRSDAVPVHRIRHAHCRMPVGHRDPVRPMERAEVAVKRTVLLHDDDHVLDLVDALQRSRPGLRAGMRSGCAEQNPRCDRERRDPLRHGSTRGHRQLI
jgi:hypothetical protein